jgi:hypothetical protein
MVTAPSRSRRQPLGLKPPVEITGQMGPAHVRANTPSFERVAVGALVIFAVAARVLVAVQLPPWQGPDEPKHVEYVRMLVDIRGPLWTEHRLPRLEDAPGYGANERSPAAVFERQVISSMQRHDFWTLAEQPAPEATAATFYAVWRGKGSQLNRTSVYYFLAAPLVAPVAAQPVEVQLLVLRLLSAVLGGLAVIVTYATGRVAVRHDGYVGLIAAALVATLPMNVFVGANANVDNLVTLVGGIVALGLARGVMLGFGRLEWLLVLGGAVLGLATKREFVGVWPAVGLVLVVWLVRNWRRAWRQLLLAAGSIVALVVALSSWTAAGGRLSGAVAAYALNEPDQATRLLQTPIGASKLAALLVVQWHAFFASFWGIFGWFTVPLDANVYMLLGAASLIAAGGLAIALTRAATPGLRWLIALYSVMIVTLTVLAFAIAVSYFSLSELPQGRHIFGVLVPISILFALGMRAWLPARYLGTRVPAMASVLLLVLLDGVAYAQSFAPYYLGHTPS